MEVNMRSITAGFLVTAFLFSGSLYGFGYPDAIGQGSPLPGADAVSQGFSGVSSVNVGGMNLFGNPAELSGSGTDLRISIGALIFKQTVDDGLGKHTLTYAGLGSSSFQAGFDTGIADVAIGIAKIRDYTYKGEYFFLDTNPDVVIAGFEDLTVSGGVWEAALGAAREIPGGIKLGVSAGYRTGDINYEYYRHHFSELIDDSVSTWSREEGEFAWRAGASYTTNGNTTAGIVYSSESENCPSSMAAGIVFGDLGKGFPGVGVEARIYNTEENAAWVGNVFGGIHPDHNLFFRGGVTLSSRGGSDSDAALGISLGTTVSFSRMSIDAAFTFNSESRNGNVFGFPEAETVADVITGFTVGATIPL